MSVSAYYLEANKSESESESETKNRSVSVNRPLFRRLQPSGAQVYSLFMYSSTLLDRVNEQ